MEKTYTVWKEEMLQKLTEKTTTFDETLHKKVETSYFKLLLEKMATHAASPETLEKFQTQMETYLIAIPTKVEFEDKEIRRNFTKKKAAIKNQAIMKHKIVTKGYYMSMWMPLGMALGMPWGVALGNIALGLPIGLAVGLAIGSWLDSKAAKEGRVIHVQ